MLVLLAPAESCSGTGGHADSDLTVGPAASSIVNTDAQSQGFASHDSRRI